MVIGKWCSGRSSVEIHMELRECTWFAAPSAEAFPQQWLKTLRGSANATPFRVWDLCVLQVDQKGAVATRAYAVRLSNRSVSSFGASQTAIAWSQRPALDIHLLLVQG